jgi:hypothetical protein
MGGRIENQAADRRNMLFEIEIRFGGDSIRVGTDSFQKDFNFALHLPLPGLLLKAWPESGSSRSSHFLLPVPLPSRYQEPSGTLLLEAEATR